MSKDVWDRYDEDGEISTVENSWDTWGSVLGSKLSECSLCGRVLPRDALSTTDDDRMLCDECWEELSRWEEI